MSLRTYAANIDIVWGDDAKNMRYKLSIRDFKGILYNPVLFCAFYLIKCIELSPNKQFFIYDHKLELEINGVFTTSVVCERLQI